MLLKIDGDTVEVVKEIPHKKHEAIEALDRVKEELEGVIDYKKLALDTPSKKEEYTIISLQEFQHMLVALDCFITFIFNNATIEEKNELIKFIKSIQAS